MKKILLFLLLLPALLFAQNQGGVIIVGGVAVHQPDTSAYKVINTIQAEGTALSGNNRFYVTYLVSMSKVTGLWGASKALYGFIGGNSASHKWNWKDMRDLDVAFRLSFVGGITHNSMGIRGDGISGYANTFFNTYVEIAPVLTSMHLSAYSNINTALNNTESSIGATQGPGGEQVSIVIRRLNNYGFASLGGTTLSVFTTTNSVGYYLSNRNSASELKVFKNGIVISQNNSSSTTTAPSNAIYLLGRNTGSVINFSEKRFSFSSIGSGLTDQQAIQASNIVTFAQGILGRK